MDSRYRFTTPPVPHCTPISGVRTGPLQVRVCTRLCVCQQKVMSAVGSEPTPSYEDQNAQEVEVHALESGALDRSATLTQPSHRIATHTHTNTLTHSIHALTHSLSHLLAVATQTAVPALHILHHSHITVLIMLNDVAMERWRPSRLLTACRRTDVCDARSLLFLRRLTCACQRVAA